VPAGFKYFQHLDTRMGYEKDRMIQEDEQGWRFSGGMDICWRCLSDP
jgi:hypothetical protein